MADEIESTAGQRIGEGAADERLVVDEDDGDRRAGLGITGPRK